MSGQSQEFCVRWNSHLGSLGAAFPQLLAGQRFVDVTLACEGHQLHCHRLVLAACSTYFESILAENPCKHPVIILPRDIKLWEIQALIDFMYKGEVNVTQAGLPNLLKCAESLQIRGLHGSDAALNLKQLKQMSKSTPSTASSSNTNDILDEDNSSNASASTSALNTNELNQSSSTMTSLTPNGAHTSLSHTKSTSNPQNALQLSCEKLIVGGDSLMTESMDDTSIKYEPYESFNKADQDVGIDDESYAAGDDSADNEDNMIQINLDGHNSSYKRVRRSEALLAQAAKCVSKGQTFQTVSNMFSIPVSTIRFYMARKGILPKRKRGRGSSGATMGGSLMSNALSQMKRSVSPTEPPFQFLNYKLPTQKPNLI